MIKLYQWRSKGTAVNTGDNTEGWGRAALQLLSRVDF